jgi:membrane associated rhomboid family serine protease
MFLHGSWWHLISNMWMMWVFGNNIEDRLGHGIFVMFYLLGGLIAIVCQYFVDPGSTTPVIGASGAVAAVLGGYAVTFPAARVRTLVFLLIVMIVDLPALAVLGAWFVLQLVSALHLFGGALDSPVAFWAHIGGFVAGIAMMPIMSIGAPPMETDWRREAQELFQFDSHEEAERRGRN